VLVAAGVAMVALLSGIGVPPALMGSAPREQDWSALAAEVRVVDGDTLRLGDRTVRLAGVEAPERGQACADAAGRAFDCGAAAAEALSRLVNGRSVVCLVAGRDRFGRGLGLCSAGGAELNAGLVTAGWALAGADDTDLLAKEAEARRATRGLWAGGFRRPEDWRQRN
jgi:endonuclease YncB( thermonuclease family)